MRFDAVYVNTTTEIKTAIKETLEKNYSDALPADTKAPVLLKPNLNANMNALTGNTTDLRIMAGVVEYLKDKGYANIAIGEGTNSGFYRNKISVISRLAVDKLCGHYGVRAVDLNYSGKVAVEFEDGIVAHVARECVEAALFINLPKLKTHFEAGMSVCLKNLMGCLVGQENKKKTHKSLSANILNISKALKPHIHIVDAVISMEGLGPTRGTPIKTGALFFGDDPYLIDMMMAKFAEFDYTKVRTLAEAARRGILTDEVRETVDRYEFRQTWKFAPPVAGPIANFIHSPKRQKYFLAIRNTALFNKICSTEIAGKILYATGLRQDVFIKDEMNCEGLRHDADLCKKCGKCAEYCPTGVALPEGLNTGAAGCVQCLYCLMVCPNGAIKFEGEMGFAAEQMRQYGNIVRKIA